MDIQTGEKELTLFPCVGIVYGKPVAVPFLFLSRKCVLFILLLPVLKRLNQGTGVPFTLVPPVISLYGKDVVRGEVVTDAYRIIHAVDGSFHPVSRVLFRTGFQKQRLAITYVFDFDRA